LYIFFLGKPITLNILFNNATQVQMIIQATLGLDAKTVEALLLSSIQSDKVRHGVVIGDSFARNTRVHLPVVLLGNGIFQCFMSLLLKVPICLDLKLMTTFENSVNENEKLLSVFS
jgi:hypothetical protein